jgi:hypothetical protein
VRRDRLQRAVVVIFANGRNAEGMKRRLCFKRLQVYHSARDMSLWEDKPHKAGIRPSPLPALCPARLPARRPFRHELRGFERAVEGVSSFA